MSELLCITAKCMNIGPTIFDKHKRIYRKLKPETVSVHALLYPLSRILHSNWLITASPAFFWRALIALGSSQWAQNFWHYRSKNDQLEGKLAQTCYNIVTACVCGNHFNSCFMFLFRFDNTSIYKLMTKPYVVSTVTSIMLTLLQLNRFAFTTATNFTFS